MLDFYCCGKKHPDQKRSTGERVPSDLQLQTESTMSGKGSMAEGTQSLKLRSTVNHTENSEKANWKWGKAHIPGPRSPGPSAALLPTRLYLLQVPQPSQRPHKTQDQVSKFMSPENISLSNHYNNLGHFLNSRDG